MVEIIPKSRDGKPNYSEDVILEKLREIKTRPDWIVLHSLKQNKVAQGEQAETDFVVFVPGKGIVLIEAKGATKALFDDGIWTMEGVDPKSKNKDPFEQIHRGRANIRKQIGLLELDHNNIPFARLVWFPKLDEFSFTLGKKGGITFATYELAFAKDLTSMIATIEECLDRTAKDNKDNADRKKIDNPLPLETAKAIAKHLLGSVVAGQSREQKAKMRELEIQKAKLEHEFIMDLIDQNQNLYFEGPAGTGKSRILRNAVKKMNTEALHGIAQHLADHLTKSGGHAIVDHLRNHVLYAKKTPMQEHGHSHIRHTTYVDGTTEHYDPSQHFEYKLFI